MPHFFLSSFVQQLQPRRSDISSKSRSVFTSAEELCLPSPGIPFISHFENVFPCRCRKEKRRKMYTDRSGSQESDLWMSAICWKWCQQMQETGNIQVAECINIFEHFFIRACFKLQVWVFDFIFDSVDTFLKIRNYFV